MELDLAGLIDEVPDVVLVIDRTGTIVFSNASSESVLGWPSEELVGQSIGVLVPTDRRSNHHSFVAGFFKAPVSRSMGVRRIDGLHRDGRVLAVDVQLAPRPDRGDVVAVIRDISRLRETQQELELSVHELAAMNSRLRAVLIDRNRLLGVAAHDLRNPLTTIVALADALHANVSGDLGEAAADGLKTVLESSLYMRDLVDDILAWSSVDDGSLRLDVRPVDMREFVESAGRQLGPIAANKGVELIISVPDELPPVPVDAAKVRQVVHNLVGNAIKFTAAGGSVSLELSLDGAFCCLAVSDEGPGLSEDDAKRIFLPFERGASKATGGEPSTGLGLAIVQRIVDGHGGRIDVHSALGEGATFEVCLPLGGPHQSAGGSETVGAPLTTPVLPVRPSDSGRADALALIDGLLREAPIACLLVDGQGVIVTANRRAHALFGFAPGQLRDRELTNLVPRASREKHRKEQLDFLASPKMRSIGSGPVVRGLHASGRELTLQVGLGTVEVGSERFALAVAEDLSERLAARREAEEAISRLEQGSSADRLVAETEVGLVVLDRDSDEVLFTNPAGRKILLETDISAVLHFAASSSSKPVKLPPSEAGGSMRDIEASVRDIEWEGRAARLVQLRDVTARERLHDQLMTIEKLGLVGQLASNVAHDFNNLLTKIQGALELARAETTSAKQMLRLAEIERSVELGAELTNRLLFLSRKTVGTVGTVDLRSVIVDVEPLMRQLVPMEISLLLDVGADVLAVHGDPVQLEQVVMNLVSNARDACVDRAKPGAWIRVRLRAAEPGQWLQSEGESPEPDRGIARVLLEVSDNGSGIAPEAQERIFEPFYSTREAGSGTGLGLSSVRAVVERSSGRIRVDSELGVGTSFTVVLPRVEAAEGVWSSSSEFRTVPGKRTVLVVDDEPAIRRILVEHLRREGLRVYDAATAVEALAVAEKLEYLDLLVTDLVMPEVDGWTLAEQLREARPGLSVLVMTGYGNDVLQSHGIDIEQIELLKKPFRLREASGRIKSLLRQTPPRP